MGNSRKKRTTPHRYHVCNNCGYRDLCASKSVHHCTECGNVWFEDFRLLPELPHQYVNRMRGEHYAKPEELLRKLGGPR
jgi:hypothetical protein